MAHEHYAEFLTCTVHLPLAISKGGAIYLQFPASLSSYIATYHQVVQICEIPQDLFNLFFTYNKHCLRAQV